MGQDYLFKLCIAGEGGAGKTSLVKRYLTGVFKQGESMTIGVDFFVKHLNIAGKMVSLQIWDFAGEDRFRFLLPVYIKGAKGVIFVYDMTRLNTLRSLPEWMTIIRSTTNTKLPIENIPIILVGSKSDLVNKRSVKSDYAISFAQQHAIEDYIECSAKDGDNVESIFTIIADNMLRKAGFL